MKTNPAQTSLPEDAIQSIVGMGNWESNTPRDGAKTLRTLTATKHRVGKMLGIRLTRTEVEGEHDEP